MRRADALPAVVVVGIDNGGSTRESRDPVRDRAREYMPYPDPNWTEAPPPAEGRKFPRFLLDEVVPLVRDSLRLRDDPASIGLAGASYGAAAALHTALSHPDRLGWLLLESPPLHLGDGRLLADLRATERLPVWLGVGTAEGAGPRIHARVERSVRELAQLLRERPEVRVHLEVTEGASHDYGAWRRRLPAALKFLLGARDARSRPGRGPAPTRAPGARRG